MTEQQPFILIAEDELPTRRGLWNTLQAWSQGRYELQTAENGLEALDIARTKRVDLLITDIRMPGLNGLELLERMKEERMETVSILLTGYAEFEYARRAMTLGSVDYLLKPVDHHQLIASVERALNKIAHRPADSPYSPAKPLKVRSESIRKAIEFISREISNPSLGIKHVAEYIHLNPSYVSVLFKEETGQTFSDYLTGQRLRLAKKLLAETDLKIYEIAESVGFSSSKYFVKVFRNESGMTPKQFRKYHT